MLSKNIKDESRKWPKVISLAVLLLVLLLMVGSCRKSDKSETDKRQTSGDGGSKNGKTYYVSTSGKNTNLGTREEPWASPAYGSRKLKPGDTLIVLGGKYSISQYDEDIIKPRSGTADAWITIKGEEANRPVLAGSKNLAQAVDISKNSYIRIENLEITSDEGARFREGILAVDGQSSNIILKDLKIHHIDEMGINLSDPKDYRILNCDITYCGFGSIAGPEGEAGGWRNVEIKGCNLSYSGHYYQGGDGSDRPYDRPDGFGIEPSSGPIEIINTKAEHNWGDGLDSKSDNTVISDCIVANNFCDGIKLWGTGSKIINCLIYGRGDGDKERTPWSSIVIGTEKSDATFEIQNTTVDDFTGNNYLMHAQYDTPDVPIKLIMRNCIFCARGEKSSIYLAESVDYTITYSLFYIPKYDVVLECGDKNYGPSQVKKLGTGNIYGDPLFIEPAFGEDGDYHLRKGSPAINAGTSKDSPDTDLEGRKRHQGKQSDIGAYEM